jgi:hypothetical protein
MLTQMSHDANFACDCSASRNQMFNMLIGQGADDQQVYTCVMWSRCEGHSTTLHLGQVPQRDCITLHHPKSDLFLSVTTACSDVTTSRMRAAHRAPVLT